MKPQCRLSRNNERSGRSKGGSQLRASGLLYSDTLQVNLHRLQVGAVVHNYKNDDKDNASLYHLCLAQLILRVLETFLTGSEL